MWHTLGLAIYTMSIASLWASDNGSVNTAGGSCGQTSRAKAAPRDASREQTAVWRSSAG